MTPPGLDPHSNAWSPPQDTTPKLSKKERRKRKQQAERDAGAEKASAPETKAETPAPAAKAVSVETADELPELFLRGDGKPIPPAPDDA
jgi:import receptor subunit TOM70